MITALCVCAIQSPKVLRIENYKVFIVTAFFSVFAYIWLYLVLAVITPDRVDLWEAILTLAFFVVLIVLAYMAEKNFYIRRTSDGTDEERGRSWLFPYRINWIIKKIYLISAAFKESEIDSAELKKFVKVRICTFQMQISFQLTKFDFPSFWTNMVWRWTRNRNWCTDTCSQADRFRLFLPEFLPAVRLQEASVRLIQCERNWWIYTMRLFVR